MNSIKRQNDRIAKYELPRSLGSQYATGGQWTNNFRKNEGMEPKQKQYPVVAQELEGGNISLCIMKGTIEDEMVGWYHRLNGHESE